MADVQLGYTATEIDGVLDRLVEPAYIHAYTTASYDQAVTATPAVLSAPLTDDQCCFTLSGGRITYTGTTPRIFIRVSSFTISTSTPSTQVDMSVYKNGVLLPGTTISRLMATSGDVGSLTGNAVVSLENGDYLETYVSADKDCTLSVATFQFSLLGV